MPARRETVELGYVSGLHGVRGWVKIFSYTRPPENVFEYRSWILNGREVAVLDARRNGRTLIAHVDGVDDRDTAAALVGAKIAVDRAAMPAPKPGEFYWADLVGLTVRTADGSELGRVERLFETGANDVLVVQGDRERLIPWIHGDVIEDVDLDAGVITVRWDPEF